MVYPSNTTLLYMQHPEGTVSMTSDGYTYNYFKTDHTGSTRVLLSAVNGSLQQQQTTDYYPFGLAWEYNNLNKNKYLFSKGIGCYTVLFLECAAEAGQIIIAYSYV